MMLTCTSSRSLVLLAAAILIRQGSASCSSNEDCLNEGTCSASGDCFCAPGFWGNVCNKICPLQCQNGGQCQQDADEHGGLEIEAEYHCVCPDGFSGPLCSRKTCPSQCQNGGTCSSAGKCVCAPGFWGNACEKQCPLLCQNGGQCTIGEDDEHGGLEIEAEYHCICPEGYSGTLCATDTSSTMAPVMAPTNGPTLESCQCQNGGKCSRNGGLHCVCLDGFTGPVCATPTTPRPSPSPTQRPPTTTSPATSAPSSGPDARLAGILFGGVVVGAALLTLLVFHLSRRRRNPVSTQDEEPAEEWNQPNSLGR